MLRFTICLILIFTSQHLIADEKKYTIDDSHFSLGFLVEHAGYSKTLGLFKHIEGDFIYNEASNSVKDLSIIVNTDSVFTNHENIQAKNLCSICKTWTRSFKKRV